MDEKISKRIEKLRAKADKYEEKAESLIASADLLREKADELETDLYEINIAAESLRDQADEYEDKADELNERADELREEADELEEQLTTSTYEATNDTGIVRKSGKNLTDAAWDNSKQRMKKVFDTWLAMAQGGDVNAIYQVGNCFYNGIGVEKNTYVALQWFKLAAEGGHYVAVEQINEMYLRGESPEQCFMMPKPLPSKPTTKKQSNLLKKLFGVEKREPYKGDFGAETDEKMAKDLFENANDDSYDGD